MTAGFDLRNIGRIAGVSALPVGMLILVALMVIPVSPVILDISFVANIMISLLILMVALQASKPLDFSAFPAVLLLATVLPFCPMVYEGAVGKIGAHRAPTRPVTAFVERDPRDPDAERPRGIIAVQRGKGGDEAFLDDVERFVAVADMAARQPPDRIAVSLHQRAIGGLIAGARTAGQRAIIGVGGIGWGRCHRAGWVSALTTAASNCAAWSGRRTARIANICCSVSFCS